MAQEKSFQCTPIGKQKPQIQEKQVDNNRLKLGRGRAGMGHKQLQPVADTSVLRTQNVTIDCTKYPVPNQLITERTKIPTTRQVQDRNRKYPCQPDPYFRPPAKPPDNL